MFHIIDLHSNDPLTVHEDCGETIEFSYGIEMELMC